MQRWRQAEQQTRSRSDDEGEGEHAPVQTKVHVEREKQESLGKEAAQPVRQPHADSKSRQTADQGERDALGEQLPNHANTSSADRQPGRNLPLSRRSARHQQPGDIGACDQQHDGDRRKRKVREPPELQSDVDIVAKPCFEADPGVSVSVRVGPFQPCGHQGKLGTGLFERDAWFQPAKHLEPGCVPLIETGGPPIHPIQRRQRDPDVARRPDQGAGERLGGNADDHEIAAIEPDDRSDHTIITAKTPLPEPVADGANRVAAINAIVDRRRQSAPRRLDAEDVEVVAGDEFAVDAFGTASSAEVERGRRDRR